MSAHLILDFGNTTAKAYVFSEGENVSSTVLPFISPAEILSFLSGKKIRAAIIASVTDHPATLEKELADFFPVLTLDHSTKLPVNNLYKTSGTLGYDRLAAAIGAKQLFPASPVLAVVAGTCITYNIIDAENNFTGGAISPGLHMRLRAMHEFTAHLPLAEITGEIPLTGTDTNSSLLSGAVHGATEEIRGMMHAYTAAFPGLKTVIAGGDGAFLAEGLKNGIFARPDLVAEGLNCILEYHVANHLI
ncbi:MAG TPA: type III pantothenate kinase [Bacteroidia bacterium]|nr:type III pantothenate kinase [Bacteroidia bacterium]